MYTPRFYTIVSGVGKAEYKLLAFDKALKNAGIGDYNIVKVTSILPPNCVHQSSITLQKGSIIYVAYATITVSNNDIGKTGIAVAIPTSNLDNGVIFEYSSLNEDGDAGDIAYKMCETAMNYRENSFCSIKKTSQEIKGDCQLYVSAISAVVMW
jgi:arginine decarboxylase